MFQIFRRIGIFRRRWIWVLLFIGGLGFAGYWAVPWRGAGAELQLVALQPDGTFTESLRGVLVGGTESDTTLPAAPPRRGVPLVLGIANSGLRSGQPERLVLSLPRWYRLIDPGPAVRQEVPTDEPLHRYLIETPFPEIQPGRVPTLVPAIDTLWLEPWVPDYYCTADADSVPHFIASTPPDTSGLVSLHIFYSFDGDGLERRQTGLLTVELPGEMFRRSGSVDIIESPVQLEQPRAERPSMAVLISGGSREAECGAPGDPMRIFSALWLTADSGRMISVHYGGSPRKEYYDLNRDSVLELEMWDPDGDGEMEAWRRLSLPIPDYMLPEPPPPPVLATAAPTDSLALDSAGIPLTTAADTAAPLPPIEGGLASLGRLLMPGDLSTARRLFVRRAPAPTRPSPDDLLGTPLGEAPGLPEDAPAPDAGAEPEPEAGEPEPERDPEPARPRRERRVPLGEPVD